MATQKTLPTNANVKEFIGSVEDPIKRQDSFELERIFTKLMGEKPIMWGPSIVGFGRYDYKYASGHSGQWPITGFSPRKQNLTIYIMDGFKDYQQQLSKLGPHKTSVSCLYIKRLSDIDINTLEEIIKQSIINMKRLYKVSSKTG